MKKIFKYLIKVFVPLFVFINIITAFYAYKFTHFYNSNEVVIQKKNKSTWDKTIDALFGSNSVKQPNTVIADSTFQVVYLATKDNLKLEGWYIKTDSTAKGTVLLFHGHAANKSGVISEAKEFLTMGYNVFLLDFRAHGNSEGNTCTIGYYETEDVKLAYDFIENKGENNIVLWGISMGAATIIKTINDGLVHPTKIILEMPYGSLLEAAEGRIRIMGLRPEPLATMITFWGGVEHGFWAFNMQPSEYAKKINCPVLLQWGRNDPRVSKAEIDSIYNHIPGSKKLIVYDSSAHESLCNNENEKWKQEVKEFLLQ